MVLAMTLCLTNSEDPDCSSHLCHQRRKWFELFPKRKLFTCNPRPLSASPCPSNPKGRRWSACAWPLVHHSVFPWIRRWLPAFPTWTASSSVRQSCRRKPSLRKPGIWLGEYIHDETDKLKYNLGINGITWYNYNVMIWMSIHTTLLRIIGGWRPNINRFDLLLLATRENRVNGSSQSSI